MGYYKSWGTISTVYLGGQKIVKCSAIKFYSLVESGWVMPLEQTTTLTSGIPSQNDRRDTTDFQPGDCQW